MILSVQVEGEFSLNGGPFPAWEYDDGELSFRDVETGDTFPMGNTHDGSYSVNVVPGRYDVLYSVQSKDALSPWNTDAVVLESVPVYSNMVLDIDLVTHTVSGAFLHNGAVFPAQDYADGVIYLDSELGGQVPIGNTHDQVFEDVPVLAGAYKVRYHSESYSDHLTPGNSWAQFGVLDVDSNLGDLELNVESVLVNGTFKHNGASMPAMEFDDGNFYLESADGDRVLLGNSHDVTFEKRVVPGQYDIYWEVESPGASVPVNERARVSKSVSVDAGALPVSMTSHLIDGDMTLNGAPFPATFLNTGQLVLRDTLAGSENVLAETQSQSYSARVVQGSYDFVYQHLQGDEVPQNKFALIAPGEIVKADRTIDIDVEARLFAAPVYHNDVLFAADASQQGNIWFKNQVTGDRALFGKTSQQNLQALFVLGTYDVFYAHLVGTQVPQNSMAMFFEGLEVAALGPVFAPLDNPVLDVQSLALSGHFYVNDVATPGSEYDDGLVHLRQGNDQVLLGNTHDQQYEQVRAVNVPGLTRYDLYYGVETQGDIMPANGEKRLGCVRLEPLIF